MVSHTIATIALNPRQKMTDFSYKKYSLENLENWLNDAISSGDATPQEIYDVIIGVVKENHDYHKQQVDQSEELINLLNNGWTMEDVIKERDYYEPSDTFTFKSCSSGDTSPECVTSWNDFWCDDTIGEYQLREAEYYNKESVKLDGYSVDGLSHSKYWYEYDRNDPNRPNPFGDRVVKWQLPVQVDGLTGDCSVNLPDDLLERAKLKEGDTIEWVDRYDGSFEMRKVNGTV
jgi:hypothetical protein